ncbi:MAG: hypothetical protein ACRBC3_18980 [Burkholderiaceae bacterium]
MLWLTACASVSPDAGQLTSDAQRWTLVPSGDPSVIVVQRNLANGLVSMMCDQEDCETLLIGEQACELTEPFPVLVNTALETSLTEGGCAEAEDTESGNPISGLIVLSEPNLLLPSIVLGDDARFAVPMMDGNIVVYVVPMDGLRALLAPLLPDLFEAPPWLDESDIPPLPEDQNTDQDLLIQARPDSPALRVG